MVGYDMNVMGAVWRDSHTWPAADIARDQGAWGRYLASGQSQQHNARPTVMPSALLLACLVCVVPTSWGFLEDFSDTKGSFEYVFHNSHDLFLVIHQNKCYFFPTRDDVEWATLNDYAKSKTEDYVRRVIQANDPTVIFPSTVDDMRILFGDILADFRCADSQIFLADPAHFVVSTTKPDGTTAEPNGTTASSGSQQYHWDPLSIFAHLIHHGHSQSSD